MITKKRVRQRIGYSYISVTSFLKQRPFVSFFIVLGLLFAVIFFGNILARPKATPPLAAKTKEISVYNIGERPTVTFQAKIEKSGVIKVVALTGGIVWGINVTEGDTIWKGQQLFTLSSNYQGGNVPGLSADIADATYKNVVDTFDEQRSIIQKQRDIANSTRDNFSDMQKIATQSASDTDSLISANQIILDQLHAQLILDQQNNASTSILVPEESQINQLQAGQNQLRSALSSLQLQTDSSKAQGRLADLSRDMTMQQLEIQEKSLELNREISKLQADIADVIASAMFPSSPFTGVVQRVYVKVGQFVSPGTPLLEIAATHGSASALVEVPQHIAKNISTLSPSVFTIDGRDYDLRPTFVPTESTNGSLFTITYPLPDSLVESVSDGEYATIAIPIGSVNTSATIPFVPLDAVYQTQDSSYVLINKNGKAAPAQVVVGDVFGDFVQITSGLHAADSIILNRNIIAGDSVASN